MHDRLVSRRIDALHQCFLVNICIGFVLSCKLYLICPVSHLIRPVNHLIIPVIPLGYQKTLKLLTSEIA